MASPAPFLRTFGITLGTLCAVVLLVLSALDVEPSVDSDARRPRVMRPTEPRQFSKPPRCHPVMPDPDGVHGSVSRDRLPWDLEAPDRPPLRVKFTQPHFTREAWDLCIQGFVIADVLVGPDGNVIDGRIDKGLVYGLDRMVAKEAKGWRYLPATKGNRKIPAVDMVIVFFNPNSPEQAPEE